MNQKTIDEQIQQLYTQDKISIPPLQRAFQIGFGRAGMIINEAVQLKLLEDGDIITGYKILDPLGLKNYLHKTITALNKQINAARKIMNQKIDKICANNNLDFNDLQQNFQLSFRRAGNLVDDAIMLKILDKNGNIKVGFKILNMPAFKILLREQLSYELKNRYCK